MGKKLMGIKDFASKFIGNFNKKSNTASHNNEDEIWRNILGVNAIVTPEASYRMYNYNSVVSDAVNKIAKSTKTLIPIIKNEDGSIQKDHKVIDFLKKPNKLQNYRKFIESVATNYILNNNSYMEVLGDINSSPIEIYSLKNTWVSLNEKTNSVLYRVESNGKFAFLADSFHMNIHDGRALSSDNLREIIEVNGFSLSWGQLQAVSRLSSIEREIRILDQSNHHNLTLLEKGFNGNISMNVDTEDIDGFERFKKDVRDNYQGSGNAGKPIVSRGKELEIKTFGQTNRDMEYIQSRKAAKDTSYQSFGIPLPLIDGSSQTYDNYQTALISFYDDSVFPTADEIFSTLTEMFRGRKMLTDKEEITYNISDIPAMQLRNNNQLKVLRDTYVLTMNELRSMIGKEEVIGGDDVLVPANLLPLASDSFTDDNISPPKKFINILERNGVDAEKVEEYWHDYKTAFRKD